MTFNPGGGSGFTRPPLENAASSVLAAARGRMGGQRSFPQAPPQKLTAEQQAEALDIISKGAGCRCCVLPGAYTGSMTPKPIESMSVHDGLLMPDGTHGLALNASTHDYNGGVRTIHARGALPLQVTDDHPIRVFPALYHRKGREGWAWRQKLAPEGEQPVWRRADEVMPGDFAVCPIPRFDGPEPPARWASADACWLLGILAGDGHTSGRNGKRYYLGVTLTHSKPVDETVRVLESLGYRVRRWVVGQTVRLEVCSRDLAEDVAALIGSGAQSKRLPDFVWSSKERLAAALQGVVDTDGCRTVHKGFEIHDVFSTSPTLAWQVWFAALALGEKPLIRSINRTSGYANASPAWRVEWTYGARRNFMIRLDSLYVMPVKKVEVSEYQGPVHDLTAAPSPTFVANGLLTHNCAGIHPGDEMACPRLASFELDGDGNIRAGSYFADGSWDRSSVVFATDAAEEGGTDG